ncbi:MAG TPA: DUF1080 domain-containing protein, partial [Vicinamibacterales bacterium]|nr:DUF1080 domain-containing protein [Vicinamibacterales bacterium]
MTTHLRTRARAALCLLLLVALVPAAPGWAQAQDVRTTATRVADILAQFPADSGAQRDRLGDQMLALGEPGLAEFTRRLVPMGAGDDVAVRWAVNAMAVRASQAGDDAKRATAERALAAALGQAADAEVRTFLLSQLRIVGRDEAVKAATPLLANAEMVEPATQLMLTVRSAAARQALLGALDKAAGPGKITIVKALGELQVAAAHDRLLSLAADADPAMQRPALFALAQIANPKSSIALLEAARRVQYLYEPANATAALLQYARQLGRNGNAPAAQKLAREIMKRTEEPRLLPTRTAALGILVELGGQSALPELLAAVDHPDMEYRRGALMLAQRLPGPVPVQQWVTKAGKVDAGRRAEIIEMLGRRRDPAALPFVQSSLKAQEPEVMLAAAEALARIEGPKANDALIALLETRTAEAPKVADVLMWTFDAQHIEPLAAKLDTLPPAAKAAAVRLIGARGGPQYAARVLPLTADPNPEIRAAAFGALPGVVGPNDLPALLRLLEGAADSAQVRDVQRAVAASVSQVTPEDARAKPLLDAMKASAHPERFIEVLPQVGGPQALEAIVAQFEGGTGDLKTAAFRALVQWRGPEAADRLYSIYAAGTPGYREQAFAGFVRQISTSSLPADQKVLQFRKALALTKTTGERRALIRALERARTYHSFLVAASFLDDPELGNDAAGAVMRITLPVAGESDGFTGTAVRAALNKVLEVLTGGEAEYEKENIRTYLKSMPQDEGFAPLFNGRDLTGWKGLVENPIARAKMTAQELAAKQAEADKKMRENWTVRDGMIVFNGSGDNVVTVKDYGNFEMLVDWRITKGGDSGIYLRGTPQVQIWDPARVDVGAQVGSGGLYNNQKHPSKPLKPADKPVGEWNTFRIRMVGEKVWVWLNDELVVDGVVMENYWQRDKPIYPTGSIELQNHGNTLYFRNIYIKELGDASAG